MKNIPEVKLGIVAVSRDCFPMSLSESRRIKVCQEYKKAYGDIYECPTVVENENDMLKALDEVNTAGCNALVVYLGNFGPESSETLLAKKFGGPVMFVAAAEEPCGDALIDNRGDAYCGMLNASYNLALRNIKAYIPEYPVGTPDECAKMISEFVPVARAILGLKDLKIISFGPRPQDFLACNAPIRQLYNMGIEIEENSELDLFESFNAHAGDERLSAVVADMEAELGKGNKMEGILPRLAQYELTLLDWAEAHKGSRKYVVFANKCWPAFQTQFGFVPVNSRLTKIGIPVACEVDIYGAVSEYIGVCVSQKPVTLLDINNTVPADIYNDDIAGKFPYTHKDTFMGFHDIVDGNITFFRFQSTADAQLKGYIAEGEVLPAATRSFGSIGIFAINEMGRFYRHVLVQKNYPHHGAVAFGHYGKALHSVMTYLGMTDIGFNQPKGMLYPTENPFAD